MVECQPGPGTDVPEPGLTVGDSWEAGASRHNIEKAGLSSRWNAAAKASQVHNQVVVEVQDFD